MKRDGDSSAPNAVSNAKFHSRSDKAVIRVYDEAGNVIETHEHKGDFKDNLRRTSNLLPAFEGRNR